MVKTAENMYTWGTTRRFNAYTPHLKNIFGGRAQKLSINAGFTCPNRDGTLSTGGCTFCNNEAFKPGYCEPTKPVNMQIEEGIAFHSKRYRKASAYLAYFQSYSNTYKPLHELKKIYNQALAHPGVNGLIIGTRPDCVTAEILDFLAELSCNYYVVLELGVESIYNRTLQQINRGHNVEATVKALEMATQRGIKTGGHFIVGLPGENGQHFLDTIQTISHWPLYSVKFHQLQIIRGTSMEQQYLSNPDAFHLFDLESYLELMVTAIGYLNPDIIVERMAGESSPKWQVNPGWGLRSDQVLTMFEKELEKQDTWQGKFYKTKSKKNYD